MNVLLEHGANVNAKEKVREQTALMWAAAQGHTEVVRVLIRAGADINARSKSRAPTASAAIGWATARLRQRADAGAVLGGAEAGTGHNRAGTATADAADRGAAGRPSPTCRRRARGCSPGRRARGGSAAGKGDPGPG